MEPLYIFAISCIFLGLTACLILRAYNRRQVRKLLKQHGISSNTYNGNVRQEDICIIFVGFVKDDKNATIDNSKKLNQPPNYNTVIGVPPTYNEALHNSNQNRF